MIWWASSSSGAFTSAVVDRLGDLRVGVDVLVEVERLEHERVAAAADEAERLAAGAHEAPERTGARLAHRLEQQPVGRRWAAVAPGYEEVGAVAPDRVDLLDRDELRDLDRSRVVVRLERLELGLLDDRRTGPWTPPSP